MRELCNLGDAKEPCDGLHDFGPVAEVSLRSEECPGYKAPLAQTLAHQSCQAGAGAPKHSLQGHYITMHRMTECVPLLTALLPKQPQSLIRRQSK